MCRQKRPAEANGGTSSPHLILVNSIDSFSPNNHSSDKAFREENEEEKDVMTVLIGLISVHFGLGPTLQYSCAGAHVAYEKT